ncbi:hypothetical protein N480_00440 [Pseudoalteromonas luteoviolacea S2607]|uniref:hypothetical protein n=1 Tax=Pseudoalteromonas luteoviolacea TaxID=43657 RepID=UPI0007B0A803|nr:hypothetical protein [Pseudoalteromonas luteoviolacea]KZN39329.1 hypothetical protein N480_00440 [Pseudoalteromonas luteoviolacea S2607]
MLNSKVVFLGRTLFFALLLLMKWFTTEDKWWSGGMVFLILSIYLVPRSISKFQGQFISSVELKQKGKAVISSMKMWFLAQSYFLGLAFLYYLVMAIVVAIGKMSIHIEGFGVAGVFWLAKVVGLLLSNVVFVPIVCISALVIYSKCQSTANKQINTD